MNIAVLGGGAAGFFSAISCKSHHPDWDVTLYEKSSKLLAKVKVSGGGRCNVTHACSDLAGLSGKYPRGEKLLKKAFYQFSFDDTVSWFESRGVRLKTEADNRIFPVSDNSQTIINCLMNEAEKLGITIRSNSNVQSIEVKPSEINSGKNTFYLQLGEEELSADKIIVATGGSAKPEGFNWLAKLNHRIVAPVPSLFTFNIPQNPITELMGVSVENALVKIQTTKLRQTGPVLITHWGLSGPAVLKLSAWGAKILKEMNYCVKVNISWAGEINEQELREIVLDESLKNLKKKVSNTRLFQIPSRLWDFLLEKSGIDKELIWAEISKEKTNRFINSLSNDEYQVRGKTTFKEEFVTCGGVSLYDINFQTMESKVCPGMYFAGEVLDIDGITGGFNFQAAWTTGYIAGKMN